MTIREALHSSESNEWYTPEWVIDTARCVMGGIDLDPASCAAANAVVGAREYYTIAQDGLSRDWYGRVWLNPPYGRDKTRKNQSNQALWSQHLIDQYKAGDVVEACLLVNAVPDRNWFLPLWEFPICFFYDRIRFWRPDVEDDKPTNGNVLVYLGPDIWLFHRWFYRYGRVVMPDMGQLRMLGAYDD